MEDQIYRIVQDSIDKYNTVYKNKPFSKFVFVKTDLKGKTAGYAIVKGGVYTIRINPVIMEKNPEALLSTTRHEMAHLLGFFAWGSMDHGPGWRRMMTMLGEEPKRCHSYAYTPARKTKKFAYICGCTVHSVGIIIHNKIQRGQQSRTCTSCGGTLTWTGQEIK